MTITLYMPDGVEINATQERQAKAALYGGGSGRQLGGRSGFRVGTPANTLTVTSTTWTLKPCAAMIDAGVSTTQGMYGWASDADLSRADVPAAHDTYARKDILYIQVNDSTAGDGTAGTPAAPVLYLAGTAAPTPSAPDLPPRSFLVGTIDVPKAGGGSPTATLNTARFVAAGAPLPVSSQASRDALTQYDGLKVIRLDLGGVEEISIGGTWKSTGQTAYTPALTGSTTNPNIGTGQRSGTYQVVGKTMFGQVFISFGTGASVGSGTYAISLPPGFTYGGLGSALPVGTFIGHITSTSDISGYAKLAGAGGSSVYLYWQSATTTASPVTSATTNWASAGTYLALTFQIPLA